MIRRPAILALAPLLAALLAAPGCSPTTKSGDLARVRVASEMPRRGNVYLLRGWIGIFSAGIDSMGEELNKEGVRASVYQEDQWPDLANAIQTAYASPKSKPEPLVLIGHSYGADSVIRIARKLQPSHIQVDLLITLDPVTPPSVPDNVLRTYNLYQTNGVMDAFPFLRGIPLAADPDNKHELQNVNIRVDRTDLLTPDLDHFNIEKQPLIHKEILSQVKKICGSRSATATSDDIVRAEPASKGTHT